jgi:hypothetical protein
MREIRLEPSEVLMASDVGRMRQISAIQKHLPQRHGASEENTWQIHIEGAIGELVVAKLLGVHWNGSINTFKRGADVGRFQIRTRSSHAFDLIVRPNDDFTAIWILVTGFGFLYRVRGWCPGGEVKERGTLEDKGNRQAPAWWVKANRLEPIETLPGYEEVLCRIAS